MIKRCKKCPNEFECFGNGRNRKYCDTCKFKVWRIQKRDWKRKKVGRYGNDLKCLDCGIFLGDLKNDRKYCDPCLVIRGKRQKHAYYLNRKNRPKLLN